MCTGECRFGPSIRFFAISTSLFLLLLTNTSLAQTIRQTDFRNFVYPWIEAEAPDQMEWLTTAQAENVKLVNGKQSSSAENGAKDQRFSGLIFESVSFPRLTLGGPETALVVLRYETGGTQYWYYVYLYRLQEGKPKLLGYFRTGERAYAGLYQVYVRKGQLVVELFDPEKRQGDCCSSGIVRTRYRWNNGKFEQIGNPEFATPRSRSRLSVSPFGIHDDPR